MIRKKNRLVLVILCISNFLCMLDTTIMTIVIPKIQSGLNANLNQVSWAVNLYAIVFASITLLAARIAEMRGENRYLLYGLILFLIGSIGSGCAPNLHFLYISRIIQSLGASFILPLGTIIGMQLVEQKNRNKIVSIIGGCQGFAAAVGPVTGGAIAKLGGWRGVFFINVPFLILLIGMIPFCMKLSKNQTKKEEKLDFMGALFSMVMMLSFTLALVQGRQWHWDSWRIITLFVLALIAFISFIIAELKSPAPMIDLSLFKSRNFDGSSFALTVSSFFLGGFVILIPTFLVKFKNLTELQAAIRILPYSITVFLSVIIASLLVKKINNRLMILVGFGLIFVSYCFLSQLQTDLNQRLMIGSILLGCGYGTVAGPTVVISAADFVGKKLTSSQSVMNVLRQVGLIFAIAICMTLLDSNISNAKHKILNYSEQQVAQSTLPAKIQHRLNQTVRQKVDAAQDGTDSNTEIHFKPIQVSVKTKQQLTKRQVAFLFQKKGISENNVPPQLMQTTYQKVYLIVSQKLDQKIKKINDQLKTLISKVHQKARFDLKTAFIRVYAQLSPFALISCLSVLILKKKV